MTPAPQAAAILDTIAALAEEIARASPESADRAMRIVCLVGEIRAPEVDRSAVADAIESRIGANGLSDATVQSTTNAVMRTLGED